MACFMAKAPFRWSVGLMPGKPGRLVVIGTLHIGEEVGTRFLQRQGVQVGH